MCRPEESIYLEHGVQQKQAIYEGLVLKTQEHDLRCTPVPGLFLPVYRATAARPQANLVLLPPVGLALSERLGH